MTFRYLLFFALVSLAGLNLRAQDQTFRIAHVSVHDPVIIRQKETTYVFCTGRGIAVWSPAGDKGGNGSFVKPGERGINLHSIWDQARGSRANPRTAYTEAIRLATEHPPKNLSELVTNKTVEAWSKESRALAIEAGYLHGKLKGSKQADDAPPLPDGYTKTMKADSEKQAALAGFRLADEINRCLKK